MDDDPLPSPVTNRYRFFISMSQGRTKQFVALGVCLFLSFAILVCPHVVFEQGNHNSWVVKLNTSSTQAPRGVFFGALDVLPQKNIFQGVLYPQLRKSINQTHELVLHLKVWLVMIWYGSSYI